MPTRAALFDFDGTLADSFTAIAASTNHVRAAYGLPVVPESVVREYVGLGLPNLMENLVPIAPVEEAVAIYREHHETVMVAGTKLLPGVADTLAVLARRGFKLAVCSNKRVEFTKHLVTALGLGPLFAAVLGPEDVGRPKPDPAMLLEALRRLEVSPGDAIYVGDMAIDVHVGKAAGVTTWIVPGGATGKESVADAGPDRILRGFKDLLDLLPAVA
ncbi:HAD family hydrolase [Fimbriiglobus ruber]|uniref:phosphoglycolate phosphatase n=1 Tax=Fimbriiglobus ruber TaxID=1908690 RepID=A0A225DQP4_9BACT|nr:HAD-IA family hydrolase [Fimbriiglobus ruber]OWK43621.1 Phosphoglycolate phosphatase [Fimbriiglobus ruber]